MSQALTPPEERILHRLKTKGAQTAAAVARHLGVTPEAVRQHLSALRSRGLVEYEDEAGRVGRPRRSWSATAAAAAFFPDRHADLAVGIIADARRAFGPSGLGRLVEERTRRQAEAYRRLLPPPRAPLSKRVAALARVRGEEGYMAEWERRSDGSFRLSENHCPICAAARACVGLCDGELRLFREVLGPGVRVEREEHLLAGARRCSYRILPGGRRASP